MIDLRQGDSNKLLDSLSDNSVDSIITDPPYGLSFMGKKWDYDVPSIEFWKKCLRVLKPGGTALIFAGSRTQHRMAINVEDAGFILKDTMMWMYGSGFPKAMDISKAFDKDVEREVIGYEEGTAPDLRDVGLKSKEAIGIDKLSFGQVQNAERKQMPITIPTTEQAKKWNGWKCLSDDSQILTFDGWKKIGEININDNIFSFDNGNIIKNKVKDIFVYNYNGEMINIKNKFTNQLVTPNHRVLCQKYNRDTINNKRNSFYNKFSYVEAKDLDTSQLHIPVAGIYNGDFSIGEDMAELVGWILTDGHFRKNQNGIQISQSNVNMHKIEKLRKTLKNLKFSYTENIYKRKYKNKFFNQHIFHLSAKDEKTLFIRKLIQNKKPSEKLWHLNFKEKQKLYNGIMLGDGWSNEVNHQLTKNEEFVEWFEIFLTLFNKKSLLKKGRVRISFSNKNYVSTTMYNKKNVKYNGKIWSVETECGNYIAKRDNKIFITGNSHSLKPAYEPILVAMKPNDGSYVENAEKWGVAGLNIEETRIPIGNEQVPRMNVPYERKSDNNFGGGEDKRQGTITGHESSGRFPTNVILECTCKSTKERTIKGTDTTFKSDDYENEAQNTPFKRGNFIGRGNETVKVHTNPNCPCKILDDQTKGKIGQGHWSKTKVTGFGETYDYQGVGEKDTEKDRGASRFFYCAKASTQERNIGLDVENEKNVRPLGEAFGNGNAVIPKTASELTGRKEGSKGLSGSEEHGNSTNPYANGGSVEPRPNFHPTVKPIELMEYLCKLTKTPTGGVVLDPFMGSGSTGIACRLTERDFIGFELDEEYFEIAKTRINNFSERKWRGLFVEEEDQSGLDQWM